MSSVSDGGRARRRRVEGNIVAAVVGRRELEGKISCCCPCSCAATAAAVSGLVSRGRGRERDLAPVKMSRDVVETRWCIVRW